MSGADRWAWRIAERVCTPAELDALRLHEQMGYRRIGLVLGISTETARDRIRRAEAKIARAMNQEGFDGAA